MTRGLFVALLAWSTTSLAAHGPTAEDPPYRTDASNGHLPWYRLKPGEFPPKDSSHRVSGELVEADFIHRTGQLRKSDGDLIDFTLLPFATVLYLNAEADLRDIPLGTLCQAALYQDEHGEFTRVAALQDEFSRLDREATAYLVTRVDLGGGTIEVATGGIADRDILPLSVDAETRVWKGKGRASLGDIAVGDEILVNLAWTRPGAPGRCADLWAGRESRELATAGEHERHISFLKERGLAARIDRVRGKTLDVSLFGDPASLEALFKREGIDPARWASEHRSVHTVVANEELRTYNPHVDGKRSRVLEFQSTPTDAFGSAGVRWKIEPDLLLEGFRKGRIIRLFAQPSWPVHDMPFGETLYTEAPNVRPATEEALQYPFRTDFANDDLPWYRLKPGEFPPMNSHHLVIGELLDVDDSNRSGRFRTDRTGEVVEFTMPPYGTILYLDAEANLGDVPTGTRCHFFLHPDERGAFTVASVIKDEFTILAAQDLNYRLDAVNIKQGKILLARRHAPVKDDKEAIIQPPDIGRGEFTVDDRTRIWRGKEQIGLTSLVVGEELLFNLRGRTRTSRGVCTEIWAGPGSMKLATETQRSKHATSVRSTGLPARIDNVAGTTLTLHFFSGSPRHFLAILDGDIKGAGASIIPVDDQLRPIGIASSRLRFKDQLSQPTPGSTYGSSGIRWIVESEKPDHHLRLGQVVRVSREGWPVPE